MVKLTRVSYSNETKLNLVKAFKVSKIKSAVKFCQSIDVQNKFPDLNSHTFNRWLQDFESGELVTDSYSSGKRLRLRAVKYPY